jgi:conjugative relaxase-like TrwC/TraI family protein
MLSFSAPQSAAQAKAYYTSELAVGKSQNYYTEGDTIDGQWHGRLAAEWGLVGTVDQQHYNRLCDGQHPLTGVQLVQPQTPRTYVTRRGKAKTTMGHRAVYDGVFSPDKSVSVTALVSGDAATEKAIRQAHDASVNAAVDGALEAYAQARLGGNTPAETTGRLIAVKFLHDSSRPVDGYAAPQLHTHVVIFNMTQTDAGDVWPLQPLEMFRAQELAKRLYQSELAMRLIELGYDIERGPTGAPVISGYSEEYLKASSPRREAIKQRLKEIKRSGAAAAQIAAHQTREAKLHLTPEEVQAAHQKMAGEFGNQPAAVIRDARQTAKLVTLPRRRVSAADAVTFAKERTIERCAVVDERELLSSALTRTMGERTREEVVAEFNARAATAEFVQVAEASPARHFTTPQMMALERDNIVRMLQGQGDHRPLAHAAIRRDVEQHERKLNAGQHQAIRQVLSNTDQWQGLNGKAGTGKSTVLATIRRAAEADGYATKGFAPTSRAAELLNEAGISSMTLQRFIEQGAPKPTQRHLYFLDESSLASTEDVHTFMERVHPNDRVLLVGDVRQHQAVNAGRPFQQLLEAGLSTAQLDAIVRQNENPVLKEIVELLADRKVTAAVERLDDLGLVHEIADHDARLKAVADDFARFPTMTLVVCPENESRVELNEVIHRTLQAKGEVSTNERRVPVLVARPDMTGAERQWANHYAVGNIIRYHHDSDRYGVKVGDYALVTAIEPKTNTLRLQRETGGPLTYDPRRLYGVTVYEQTDRQFAVGDRVQFTAPERLKVDQTWLRVANRERGVIKRITIGGRLHIELDAKSDDEPKRVVVAGAQKHLDYGYAMTTYSAQGQTVDRTLMHVDIDHAGVKLVNERTAYVGGSRPRLHFAIYSNGDAEQVAHLLGRQHSHPAALQPEMVQRIRTEAIITPTAG